MNVVISGLRFSDAFSMIRSLIGFEASLSVTSVVVARIPSPAIVKEVTPAKNSLRLNSKSLLFSVRRMRTEMVI